MKIPNQLFLCCHVLLFLIAPSCLGQTPPQNPPQNPPQTSVPYNPSVPSHNGGPSGYESSRKARMEADSRMREAEARRRALNNRKPGSNVPIVLTEEELSPEERKALQPTPEDLKANADFLRQNGTGIFRLMRVDQRKHQKVVSASDILTSGAVLLHGGGAYYSFTKKTHNANPWTEIQWDEDFFLVGVGGQSVSAITQLVDVRLEDISLDSKGVSYLAKIAPATTEAEAEQQFQQLEAGVSEDWFKYRSFAPWELNTTYALRSINYGRSDLLVAFRVIRQDQNGSLIVLWKKLKSYNTPKLKKDQKN